MRRIVVVGASLAGLRAVEALRREGYEGALTLVGEEPHAPYDRPPLSKQVLRGEWGEDRLDLRRGAGLEELELDARLGVRATGLDGRAREVQLADGSRLPYDGLLIATGARARRLPLGEGLSGVHVVRTLEDATALRDALVAGPRVCVIGAGFIGLEVAASCRALGLSVTAIEGLPLPLVNKLGVPMAAAVADLHRAEGVDLRCGVTVAAIEGDGRVERVRLSDGAAIDADLLVMGVGVAPNVEWLQGSGIELDDGVLCDARCATALPDVVAAGDVARWPNALFDETMRVEHWTHAVEQANAAVQRLLRGAEATEPFAPAPYFWSDQYNVKVQFAGRAREGDELQVIEGSVEARKLVALYGREGRVTGVLTWNRPPKLIAYRRQIAQGLSWADAVSSASS